LKPEAAGSFLFKKSARSYGIEPPLFYRQSGMFVAWLRERNAAQFRVFLLDLEDGGDFETSFDEAFGLSLDKAWQSFVEELRSRYSASGTGGTL
jgi:hypothetical protein